MSDDSILTGWKSIANFLHISVKTLRRLHRFKKLPIKSAYNSIVMANKDDLEKWVKSCPDKKI